MPVISLDKIKNGAVLNDSFKQTAVAKSEAIQNQNLYISDLLKTEGNKPGSGFIGNTQTASGSGGKTTTPTPAKENLYNDLVNQKPKDYSPNAEGLANTGAGAEAAVGTQYSWNKQGTDKAQKQYQSDVLAQKDKLLTQAQQTANNAVNYQTQADMMKYQNNQNAEKVGWTGGYVLDQNKQSEYLKASIQAQMYGAMELQKYGYDSALAAARLSYDLNQQEYARQYYNDAVSAALSEAQLTGTYFSAETKDMMSQFAVAEQKLNDPTISEEERTKAESIKSTIKGWFQENNISEAGVKTMAAYQFEAEQAFQWNAELYTRYNAAIETIKQDQQNNVSLFIKVDNNGNPIFNGMDVETLDFSTVSADELASYIKPEGSEKLNKSAQQQVQSYINYLYKDALTQAQISTKDNQGNVTTVTNLNKKEYKEAINKMTSIMDEINKLCGEGTITDPRPTKEGGQDQPQNGPENPDRQYLTAGDWDNDTQIIVNTNDGEKLLTTKLQYMNWNDSNNVFSDSVKNSFAKSVLDITYSSLSSGWKDVLKNELKISSDFSIETLPTTMIVSKTGNLTIDKSFTLDGYTGGQTVASYSQFIENKVELGGQIEYFLKDYYEHTTGTKIKVGSMIVIGNHVMIWAGDDGKGLAGITSKNEARWVEYIGNTTIKNQLVNL